MQNWIPLMALAGVGAYFVMSFNRLAALNSRCDRAFADIDVQLKHRHNLLPNLLETVKGFVTQEKDIFEKITAARARALSATGGDQLRAESALSTGITQLLTVAESYPELQSSGHFRELRQEISDSENKISASRRFLNAAVDEYNATLGQFPANLIAKFTPGYSRRAFFDIGVERVLLEDAPQMKF